MTGAKGEKRDELIDQNLRRVYQSVIEEDIPDRFKDLLSKLQSGQPLDRGAGTD